MSNLIKQLEVSELIKLANHMRESLNGLIDAANEVMELIPDIASSETKCLAVAIEIGTEAMEAFDEFTET